MPTEDSQAAYAQKYPNGYFQPYPTTSSSGIKHVATHGLLMAFALAVGVAVGVSATLYMTNQGKQGYQAIA